ncbi:hypothetical protein L1987_64103 [Smallanthus sonchifolius]|uniref:Uncharacterized protein n=1 Tax=Smallanthus sonchifolius TaxID=185202 RepID=A0ACB9CF48_9ASTR|nr:hypothetical protein L1987_64103 [Smallanthus sonchifolius]
MYTTLMRENSKFYEMTIDEAIGKVQAHDMNSNTRPFYVFWDNSSRNPSPTSSANQSAIAKIVEDHVALFSSCMLAYENFIGGKLTDPEIIEEDFNQVDPDDMEDMDIQWNMAMILRRAKRFLNRTGRKFIGGHSNAKVGLMAEIMEMMEAEEREASVADQVEFTTTVALMAIGEASYKRNNEINKLQNEILQLKGNIEKLKNSRFVVEHYESVVRQVNGLGLGTNAIPPPVSGKFVNSLIDIDLFCLDESSSQDVSSNKDDSSSKNTCPEGVVSEELLGEQKVKKNIITDSDNCILTEPDIIVSNEKLKVMLYGGYKNINQVKKEAFSPHFGLGYQENLQKFYTPKNQSSSGQTTVHQTTFLAHHAESSNARSNEPYRRTYKEKRTCFHCGMVGHILVNCPAKNQGKRPIVSQPAVIPKLPLVKHSKSPKANVVKPPVKPMVKPKITSEAKPSVSKRGTLPTKPSASTSGSAPTSEKPMVKLSKPQRRRRNKRLRKLEQLAGFQSGEASTSSPAAVESKSTVPVKKKKRSWNKKSKSFQSPCPNSSKDSSIFDSHDCELIEGHPKGTISNRWYVDSGCSRHMTGNMALLQDVKPLRSGYVAFAGEKGGSITCQGVVSNGCVSFDNVNYYEQLKHNLLSISQIFTVTEDCMPCKKGKQQRNYHKPKLLNSIDTPLELLHMDLFGPISIRSIGGTKNETADILQYLILSLESFCKLKVRRIRSDNGTEFKNNLMELFCLKKGICHEFSASYTPQQNGVTEQKNKTLIKTARTMLVLVVKRHNKTCYELINNRPPNLDYLVPFAIPCSLLLQYKDRKSKFHAKAVDGFFLGYVVNSPCKRVYNIGTRTIEEWFEVDCSKHNIPPEPTGPAWGFDYDALLKSFNLPDLSVDDAANVYELFGGGDDSSFSTLANVPIVTPDSNVASASETNHSDNIEDVHVDGNDAQANPNTRDMGELSTNLDSEIQEPNVPETRVHKNHPIDNIIGDPHAGVQTRHRTIAENTSLYSEILDTGVMETYNARRTVSIPKVACWDLVDLPRGVQPIGTRWVFKCKTDDRHVVVKNKARLVVQGFYQQGGLDYTEVYAPVARLEANRLFLAYASYVGFKVYQLDVKSAFLYGKVHEEVYVTQPPGFEDPHNINKVYKLDKALYGLHQAPLAWEFERVMKSKFEMSNMGELSFFLGRQVSQRDDGIYLHQTKYVQDILSKYKMNGSSTYGTPIPVNHGLHPDKDGKDVDCKLYRGMIGSLMYLTPSRPDIIYLKGKPRLGLWYSKQQSFDFKAYTDSDYGGCNLDRKSTSGGCQFLGDRLVSWQCKKQSTVSVSTCEVEYIAAASGCSQILWIQQQLRDYGLNFTGTPLFIDNNTTMSITNNPVKHSKTKHIEIRHHFIRECAEKHLIELVKVHTDDNFAELFTKAFDRTIFEHLVNLIGMFNPE